MAAKQTIPGLTLCLLLPLAANAPAENLAAHVLVVANQTVPESVRLAHYYAERRGVPRDQICLLDCPATEEVSRRVFTEQIETPIRDFLERKGLLRRQPVVLGTDAVTARSGLVSVQNQICFMVLCYGVPLKVAPDPALAEEKLPAELPTQFRRNEAAVDSELALLPVPYAKTGFVPNPLYGVSDPTFRPPQNLRLILVTRLDGPSAAAAQALVDSALEVESLGLAGRAYFDARGLRGGAYVAGDEWIRACYQLSRNAGFESVLDEQEAVFDEGYPMSDCALYVGWYTQRAAGPFARKSFRFAPGAFAYHLHSFSASSIRSESTAWVGPLLARGAAATMGCVYEPYLHGSPRVALFLERFLQGYTFAESAYASQPWLSWQTAFVGDPLYRPFALGLEEQIERLERMRHPLLDFARLRQINLLLRAGDRAEALARARHWNENRESPVLSEKIGDLLTDEDLAAAVRAYQEAIRQTSDDWQAIRLHYKVAEAYQKLGKDELALLSLETILRRWPAYEGKLGLYLKLIPLAAKVGPLAKAEQWKDEALQLNPALTNEPSFRP